MLLMILYASVEPSESRQDYKKNHLCEIEVGPLRRRLIGLSSLRNLAEPGNVHGLTEHNYENQNCAKKIFV